MPATGTIKMRADQFLQLGEDPPGVRLELVKGEVVVSPSPIPKNAHAVLQLGVILVGHVNAHDLGNVFGDVDTILDQYNVRRPDVLYFAKDRLGLVGEKAMEGPPDLAVEVISPSSVKVDRKDKFNEYRKAGVAHYWIIDPEARTFEGYTLRDKKFVLDAKSQGEETISLPPFPDLIIPLTKLWWKWGK